MFGLDTFKLVIAGAIALAIVGLIATAAIYRGNAIKAEAELETKKLELAQAVTANKTNIATIERLRKQSAFDSVLIESYVTSLNTLTDEADALRTAVEELRGSDAEVNTYLSTPIPPALARLLNGSTGVASDANGISSKPNSKGVANALPKAKN